MVTHEALSVSIDFLLFLQILGPCCANLSAGCPCRVIGDPVWSELEQHSSARCRGQHHRLAVGWKQLNQMTTNVLTMSYIH